MPMWPYRSGGGKKGERESERERERKGKETKAMKNVAAGRWSEVEKSGAGESLG